MASVWRYCSGLVLGVGVLAAAGCGGGSNLAYQGEAGKSGGQVSAVKSGPQLGYVWTPSDATLRPILGVPGASQIGKSIVAAHTYTAGASSPVTGSGLLEQSDGSLVALHLPASSLTPVAAGLPQGLDIEYAPRGATAVAYAKGSDTLLLVTGLPDSPVAQAITAGSAISSAAVSDAGSILFATAQGAGAASVTSSGTTVSVMGKSGKSSVLLRVQQFGGMSFVSGTENAVVADGGAKAVTLIRDAWSNPSQQAIAVPALSQPFAVGAAQDGSVAVIANAGERSLVRVDLTEAAAPVRVPLSFQPSEVAPLLGNGVFRLTGVGQGPTWMVDATAATPKVLFIPAIVTAAAGQNARAKR